LALPFTLKNISRQKKNYENSNMYFTMQKYNLKKNKKQKTKNKNKNPLKETKILQDIIITL